MKSYKFSMVPLYFIIINCSDSEDLPLVFSVFRVMTFVLATLTKIFPHSGKALHLIPSNIICGIEIQCNSLRDI